jgi:hypothetical protein
MDGQGSGFKCERDLAIFLENMKLNPESQISIPTVKKLDLVKAE